MASAMMTEIIEWLNEYKVKTRCAGVVLGISGGKDSTTVAMLAKKVWGDNVIGVLMPNSHQGDIEDSKMVCEQVGIRSVVVNIGDAYSALLADISKAGVTVSPKAVTNIPPRLRMTTLYAIAQSNGYRVIGTGNASEAYIGWTTKWGDSAYDINPIYHLTCHQVVELGVELAKEFCVDEGLIRKPPADGITGMSDEDNFGFTYDQLDRVISSDTSVPLDVVRKICDMHIATQHKRRMPYTMAE